MFVRIITSKGNKYLNIIDGYRDDNGKIKQKVIANLGRLDELSCTSIENIASKLLEFVKSDKTLTNKAKTPNLKELDRYNYGFIAYRNIWNRFKLDTILDTLIKQTNIQYDFKNVVFSIVVDRLLKPKSKLATFINKDDYININDELKLHHIYRSLDILASNKENIELALFAQNKNLFNISTDIVFYDVTTFYYESKDENALKKFGYSKDSKFGDVQVVMGMLIDKNGLPIGYELFSGNTMDTKTMVAILDKLKSKFQIDTVVIVADRGLNSKLNLKAIKDAGYDYLMACKIKSMNNEIQKDILNIANYSNIVNTKDTQEPLYSYYVKEYDNKVKYQQEVSLDASTGEVQYETKEITLKEKLICTYSTKRATKDMYDRYRALQKANEIISKNQKSAISQTKSFKKYIFKETKDDSCKNFIMGLDWLKIKKDKTYDGFYAITTSKTTLEPLEIIDNYHNLYKIEDSFRVLKSTFNTRPIYHHKESRIEAHFIVCFIAFMIERDLEIRLKNSKSFQDKIITPNGVKEALNSLEVSKIKIDNEIFYMRSNHSNQKDKLQFGRDIHKFLRIPQLKNINTQDELIQYIHTL
ncbi:MAG: IS1634 family transposase [Campylobacterales bacterium]|nr:IS1634 family transposase [Campylobacterales bacterium]